MLRALGLATALSFAAVFVLACESGAGVAGAAPATECLTTAVPDELLDASPSPLVVDAAPQPLGPGPVCATGQ
jgi:hypothetical protein